MSNKTKMIQKESKALQNATANLGVFLMTAATALGMVEVGNHSKAQVILPNRPVFAFQEETNNNLNTLRRERDETAPHYISYSESQRTPSRSSKH